MTPTAAPVPRPRRLAALAGWVLLSLAAGALGGFATRNAPTFYAELDRPAWAPPAALFGPVWTALYLLMGVAAWLVWREAGGRPRGAWRRRALALFVGQLALNALWSWVFFAWRRGGLALAELLALWVLVALTLAAFWRVRRAAAALLLPYLAWVTYAAALTAALWRRNPQLL